MTMMINSIDIYKQCAINSLFNSTDLQEMVKQFVFYNKTEAEARRNKNGLINQLKLGINYRGYGHWALSFRYEVQLQAVNCSCCGQYHVANHQDYTTLNPSLICYCDEEYAEEIMSYVYKQSELIHIVEEEENEDEEEPFEGITIDYGISYLLR